MSRTSNYLKIFVLHLNAFLWNKTYKTYCDSTTKLLNGWDEIKTKGPSKCVESKLTPKGPFFLSILTFNMTLTFSSEQLKAHKEEEFAKMSMIFNTKEGDVIN